MNKVSTTCQKKQKPAAHLLTSLGLILFSISCSAVFMDDSDIIRLNDETKPQITLITPQDNSYYASTVIITGKVEDFADNSGTPGRVDSLSFEIPGTIEEGEVPRNQDGTFQFSFSTMNFSGAKVLKLRASDWKDNLSEIKITLLQGAFPEFRVTAGNQQATLSWNPVTLAESYAIYYTDNKTIPSAANCTGKIANAVSPAIVSGLKNGFLYTFKVQSHSTAGADNESAALEAMPLSPFTLAPEVTGEYLKIRLAWSPVNGTGDFIVKRALTPEGPYTNISGPWPATTYLDENVTPGRHYYYKIAPALDGSGDSAAGFGETAPFAPYLAQVTSLKTGDQACRITLAGDYAYVADLAAGLTVLNISDPLHPFITASLDTPGYARDVAVSESYAYIADDDQGLRIAGLSDPALPVPLGKIGTTGYAVGVAAGPDYVCLACSAAGLLIIDVADKNNPQLIGTYLPESGTEVTAVALAGSYAYLACGTAGLRIISLADPAHPQPVGSCTAPGKAYDLFLAGQFAYLANGNAGLQIIEITDPANPQLYEPYPLVNPVTGSAAGISVRNKMAFMATGSNGLQAVDITKIYSPVPAGRYQPAAMVMDLALQGRYAYLACNSEGIHIVDAGSPGDWQAAGSYDPATQVLDVAVRGDYAFLAGDDPGLQVLNLNDKNNPLPAGRLPLSGPVRHIKLRGNFAFLTGRDTGLQVVDLSLPAAPVPAGSLLLPDKQTGKICLAGDFAYVPWLQTGSTRQSGLAVINIAKPAEMRLTGIYTETDGAAHAVALKDGYAFLMRGDNRVSLIDISDPADPGTAIQLPAANYTLDIVIRQHTAYLADGNNGLLIWNAFNPQLPEPAGHYNTPAMVQSLKLSCQYAFLAEAGGNGLQLIGITDPARLYCAGAWQPGSVVQNLCLSGRYGYLAAGDGGLQILNFWPYP